jgi:hypothetical protein
MLRGLKPQAKEPQQTIGPTTLRSHTKFTGKKIDPKRPYQCNGQQKYNAKQLSAKSKNKNTTSNTYKNRQISHCQPCSLALPIHPQAHTKVFCTLAGERKMNRTA